MKRVRFEGGLEVWGLNRMDATVLHQQIFIDRSYARYAFTLPPGSRVFDVGANIGLFSTWLTATHPDLELFLFEPLPEIFAALERNAAALPARCHLFACGLAGKNGAAEFDYDPSLSSMSTMLPGTLTRSRQPAKAHAWAHASIDMLEKAGAIPRPLGRALTSALASAPTLAMAALAPVGLALAARQRLVSKRIRCPLRTVSDVIAEHQVDRLELLKVDVEGAEELVLDGIADHDWPKIQQLVIEVSDVDGRVKSVEQRLRARGFRVTADQDEHALMRLLGLFNVYASRLP